MSNADSRILVVDDEDFSRKLSIRHLIKEGFEDVETAENGKQALEMARKQNFDLVLLDIEMPATTGPE